MHDHDFMLPHPTHGILYAVTGALRVVQSGWRTPSGRASRFGGLAQRRLRSRRWSSPFPEHKDDRLTVREDTTTWPPCSPPPAWKSPSPRPSPGREGSLYAPRLIGLLAALS